MTVGIIISIAFFNGFGVAVTKHASAAQRSTIDTSRTVLIWLFFLILGKESFHFLQLAGFILLVFGTLVYNEIITVPILGFNLYTKKALATKEKEAKGLLLQEREAGVTAGQTDYVALSPHAGYDNNRNRRQIERKMETAGHKDDGDNMRLDINQS